MQQVDEPDVFTDETNILTVTVSPIHFLLSRTTTSLTSWTHLESVSQLQAVQITTFLTHYNLTHELDTSQGSLTVRGSPHNYLLSRSMTTLTGDGAAGISRCTCSDCISN